MKYEVHLAHIKGSHVTITAVLHLYLTKSDTNITIHNIKFLDLLLKKLFLINNFSCQATLLSTLRKQAPEYLWHSSDDPK